MALAALLGPGRGPALLPGRRASPARLAAAHEIRTVSIFDLPPRTWDLGSMFFVADGMTTDEAEFEPAVRSFLAALVPGSPFLMAFMEGSTGYDVSGISSRRCGHPGFPGRAPRRSPRHRHQRSSDGQFRSAA